MKTVNPLVQPSEEGGETGNERGLYAGQLSSQTNAFGRDFTSWEERVFISNRAPL